MSKNSKRTARTSTSALNVTILTTIEELFTRDIEVLKPTTREKTPRVFNCRGDVPTEARGAAVMVDGNSGAILKIYCPRINFGTDRPDAARVQALSDKAVREKWRLLAETPSDTGESEELRTVLAEDKGKVPDAIDEQTSESGSAVRNLMGKNCRGNRRPANDLFVLDRFPSMLDRIFTDNGAELFAGSFPKYSFRPEACSLATKRRRKRALVDQKKLEVARKLIQDFAKQVSRRSK